MDYTLHATIVLGVGAICVTIAGTSCSTNARIDDMRSTHEDIRMDMRSDSEAARAERSEIRDRLKNVEGDTNYIRGRIDVVLERVQ